MELQEEVFENQVLKYWKIKWQWKNKSLTRGLKYKWFSPSQHDLETIYGTCKISVGKTPETFKYIIPQLYHFVI